MSQQQSEMPSQGSGNIEQFFSIVLIVFVRGLCATVEVFLHQPGTFGSRYAGLQVVVGALLIFLYPVFFWQGQDPTPLYVFLVFYIAALMQVRIRSFLRSRRGGVYEPHSQFAGTPRLMRVRGFRKLREQTVLSIVEPVMVIVIGGLIAEVYEPLGMFLVIAGFALLSCTQMQVGEQRERARRIHDAQVSQQNIVATYRERYKH